MNADIHSSIFPGIDFIEKQAQRTNVLVHCLAGISRSATIMMAYLMKATGKSLQEVFIYTKDKRAEIKPNRNFIQTLLDFEGFLKVQTHN